MPSDLASRIDYSEKYSDDSYEYRHVTLPQELAKQIKHQMEQGILLTEDEWRGLGVTQSRGWTHYAIHKPEPNILLFRRPLGTNPLTGKVETGGVPLQPALRGFH